MTFEGRIFLTFLLVMLTITLMRVFQRAPIACFIAIWLLMPNKGQVIFGFPPDVPQFLFVELAAALMLVYIAVTDTRYNDSLVHEGLSYKHLGLYQLLFFLILVSLGTQLLVSTILISGIIGSSVEISIGRFFASFSGELSGVCFLFSLMRLIRSVRDVEIIMGVFICFSVILLFNFFGLQILADPPESLRNYSFDDNGLFKSIFLNDYILVGLVGGLSSLFSIYFAISRWSYRWLLMSFACSILVFVNLKRSVILAFLVSIFVVFIIEFFQLRISKRKLNAGFFVCLLITVFGFFAYYTSPIVLFSSDYITSRFATFGSFDSVFTRLGIHLRGIEVISHFFPFGVGNDMLRFYMPSEIHSGFFPTNRSIQEGYFRVIYGAVTESHNGYLEQVASYGLLGLVSLLLLIFLIGRNLASSWKVRSSSRGLYSVFFAISVMVSIFYLFLGYPRLYFLIFLLLQVSYILRASKAGFGAQPPR